jgi:hypothetical protein
MKKKILKDVKIICEPPQRRWGGFNGLEDEAIFYEKWVKEFEEFIRDHRSQDPVYLNVEREYKECCEFCEEEWETSDDSCPLCCQKAVDEFETNRRPTPTHLRGDNN